jgi:hypothetical protein
MEAQVSQSPQNQTLAPEAPQTTKPVETATPEVAPKVPDHELEWTKRFNTLSKKEKMLLDQKRQIDEQRKSIAEFNELKKLAQENPTELFSKLGITYDDVTNFYLNDGKVTDAQKLKAFEAKINSIEEERKAERLKGGTG